jgi:hypothetical protein
MSQKTFLKMLVAKDMFNNSEIIDVKVAGDKATVRVNKAQDVMSPATAECDLEMIKEEWGLEI